jgi:hypothetical protein
MSFKELIINCLSDGKRHELLTFELAIGRPAKTTLEADTFVVDVDQLRKRGMLEYEYEGCEDPWHPYYFDAELTAYGLLLSGRSLSAG